MPGKYKPIIKTPKCCSSFSFSMSSLDYEGSCSNENCPLKVSFRLDNPQEKINSCCANHKQSENLPQPANIKKCVLSDAFPINESWYSLMSPCGVTSSEVQYQFKPTMNIRKVYSNPDESIYANKRNYSCCMQLYEVDTLLAELLPDAKVKKCREKTIQTERASFATKHTNTSKIKTKETKKKVKIRTTKNSKKKESNDKKLEDKNRHKKNTVQDRPMRKPTQIPRRSPNFHCHGFSNCNNQCCMTSRFLDASSRVVYPYNPCAWRPCSSMTISYPAAYPCHHQWCFAPGI